ncbi:hypothetical protein GCK72_022101 [Caenorhabditis remanei]|uniref:Uncharacterized protein n=1 Tax=Caenorhabditis remanei TaxID=31234 RepID=A0A6A5FSW3_CAERE|nr:hypothetical protein GCK72_022101 [Caenorhabditis remanei]KAF1745654.1 hypothetical protein GCK72_022101 [Caenorhabditis remanei]
MSVLVRNSEPNLSSNSREEEKRLSVDPKRLADVSIEIPKDQNEKKEEEEEEEFWAPLQIKRLDPEVMKYFYREDVSEK